MLLPFPTHMKYWKVRVNGSSAPLCSLRGTPGKFFREVVQDQKLSPACRRHWREGRSPADVATPFCADQYDPWVSEALFYGKSVAVYKWIVAGMHYKKRNLEACASSRARARVCGTREAGYFRPVFKRLRVENRSIDRSQHTRQLFTSTCPSDVDDVFIV